VCVVFALFVVVKARFPIYLHSFFIKKMHVATHIVCVSGKKICT
jgi:hypothetical protein